MLFALLALLVGTANAAPRSATITVTATPWEGDPTTLWLEPGEHASDAVLDRHGRVVQKLDVSVQTYAEGWLVQYEFCETAKRATTCKERAFSLELTSPEGYYFQGSVTPGQEEYGVRIEWNIQPS